MAKQSNVESVIDKMTDTTTAAEAASGDAPAEKRPASFKMYENSRIPVPKSLGPLYKMRKDVALTQIKKMETHEAWDEAVAYYKNDHTRNRVRSDPNNPGGGSEENVAGGAFSQTENIVFSNASAIVPAVYAKNPEVTITSTKGNQEAEFSHTAQRLIRTLIQKRTTPGVNLKPKIRRAVVMSVLCNISYIEVGYTQKEQSSDFVLEEVADLAQQLEKAKSTAQVEEIEGKLAALVDKVDLLSPSGPWTKYRHPKDVIVDPDALSPDLTDAKWVMIGDYIDTSFINAVYRTKNKEGELVNVYKPTHVLQRSGEGRGIAGHDMDITSFSLLQEDNATYRDYGYEDEDTFERAKRTRVWYVWDRITRRVYLFADNHWAWPIWVWDDPYGLDEFFPLYPLAFHTDPEDMYARGEVSYYLDQQDEINVINSQVKRMRHRVANTLMYNKSILKDETGIRSILEPSSRQQTQIIGLDLPPEIPLGDVVGAPPMPALEYPQLFDKGQTLEAIDRVSGVSAVMKNVEYKTNTTNRAIESYESSTQLRLDEKIDAVEELIGRVGNAILVMCLQFMDKMEVEKLIGHADAQHWPDGLMQPREAQEAFELRVVGGSSLKPTSKVRKEHAMEMGQILGQFAQASPIALMLWLKQVKRAFSDEIDIERSDWEQIEQHLQQTVEGEQQQQQQQQEGGQPQQGDGNQAIVQQLEAALLQMPDEIRQQVGQAIAEGVPLSQIMSQLSQMQQQQPV